MNYRSVRFTALALLGGAAVLAGPQLAAAKDTAATATITVTTKSPEALAAFNQGRDLADNLRMSEAAPHFEKAIAADSGFALAHAYLGAVTPGASGLKHLEQAASLGKDLPAAERTLIGVMLADRNGDVVKQREMAKSLTELAPGDWRSHFMYGAMQVEERNWESGVKALARAAELNPGAGVVHNNLGYAYLNQGKANEAADAFRKYASLAPNEPNPHDSLGEALMAAGKFAEAEAAFRKAAEVSPSFHYAWEGIANAQFLAGQWVKGRESLARGRAVAPRPIDRCEADNLLAWSHCAEGNAEAAMKTVDALEKAAKADAVGEFMVWAPISRAAFFIDQGKHAEAIAEANRALETLKTLGLPGGQARNAKRDALAVRIEAEAKLGQAAEAKTTLGLMEEIVAKSPGNPNAQSTLAFARGSEAWARNDVKEAITAFNQCIDTDYYCRLTLARAQDKAGEKAAAEATRAAIRSANRRGNDYLYARNRLGEAPVAAAAKEK